ncbi:bifunctional diaminohydroxyphosphoribosylaminopyrimidine deaminase/5-amino-6-(5-phosphoribosylamino)uracil reductase RibD [Herpetosiphon llansteffanensis]|uniref:bifunctional diaminohydroxyphosphoribosylaminopyrimidine deaminase/5-amino-6-(5-phosphoribosylamino)uracil reductase RibD n=1 Tax=Herpetosiphon llansteffanensis TaxID=2094568 RepID=UPI00196B6BF2|nr:bifunctional diaminohydroxyphosphoribosylaminopyrimidine deaminase/5-amino-6-(5-phosphoribosylamino)uracil reductase RibD [Herpetosiphon llansteffanensis]
MEQYFMQAALEQANLALGRTSPNPAVGAVVVQAGQIIGRGYTQPPGQAHAEIMALREAGDQAHGATLYVTLEPCTIWGRTPPCTDAIITAGIREVVIAARDPNPRFEHDAASVLQAAGIQARFDQAAEAAAIAQTEAFRHWIVTKQPFVTVKYAMSLDGKIATRTGDARWISGPASRQKVHRLRDQTDAILVGINTVLADDPLLTTRLEEHWRPVQHPLRIVLDARGRMPASAAMLADTVPGTTIIATTAAASAEWRASISNAEILELPSNPEGRIMLGALLTELGQRGVSSLLVEGGGETIAAFLAAQAVQKLQVVVAPKIIGGVAPSPVGGVGIARMSEAQLWQLSASEQYGADVWLTAYPNQQLE